MNEQDKILLGVYMRGFLFELGDGTEPVYKTELDKRAFKLGKIDAIVGDECESLDNESTSSILSRIKDI